MKNINETYNYLLESFQQKITNTTSDILKKNMEKEILFGVDCNEFGKYCWERFRPLLDEKRWVKHTKEFALLLDGDYTISLSKHFKTCGPIIELSFNDLKKWKTVGRFEHYKNSQSSTFSFYTLQISKKLEDNGQEHYWDGMYVPEVEWKGNYNVCLRCGYYNTEKEEKSYAVINGKKTKIVEKRPVSYELDGYETVSWNELPVNVRIEIAEIVRDVNFD